MIFEFIVYAHDQWFYKYFIKKVLDSGEILIAQTSIDTTTAFFSPTYAVDIDIDTDFGLHTIAIVS